MLRQSATYDVLLLSSLYFYITIDFLSGSIYQPISSPCNKGHQGKSRWSGTASLVGINVSYLR